VSFDSYLSQRPVIGACGGELACSTCHLVFEKEIYDTLPPKTDEEEDMLDLAFELTET
jgi:ferredoxin